MEVRFSNLSVDAKVLMGSANLPTLPNAVIGYLDVSPFKILLLSLGSQFKVSWSIVDV